MGLPTNFTIQAGEPFPTMGEAQRIRVALPADRSYWLAEEDFEVLMQVRQSQNANAALVTDLADNLAISMDGTDILIDWSMTGSDTRSLGEGWYDMVLSDTGPTDAHALVVLAGRIRVKPIVTAAESA